MPLFGPIPMSDPNQGFSDIAELLMKNKLTREQMRQFNEQMAIQKAEEKRKQDMFPYLLQKAQQEQNLADRMYKEFFGEQDNNTQESKPTSQQPGMNAPKSLPQNSNKMMNNMSMLQQFIDSGQAKPEDIEQINQFMGSQGGQPNSGKTPFAPMPEAMNMPRKDIISLANQRAANAPNMGIQVPNQVVNQVPIQNKPQKFEPEKMGYGERVFIKQPDKMKAAWDKFPGQTVAGFKIPDLKPPVIQDGIEYQQWPSGAITATKVGKSEQEKADIAVKKAEDIAQNKANTQQSKLIEKTSNSWIEASNYIKNMINILDTNSNAVNPTYGIPLGIGKGLIKTVSGTDTSEFSGQSGLLAAEYAKLESTRPGIGMIKFFESTKPSVGASLDYNIGMLLANAKKVQNGYEADKKMWQKNNPDKEFPTENPGLESYIKKLEEMKTKKEKGINNKHWIYNPTTGKLESK